MCTESRCARLAGLAALALASVALAACSGGSAAPRSAAASAPSLPTPLATSIQGSTGTWATLPMGRLSQPLNTFWQLLYRPAGGESWSNQVRATAVATNGGIVLASAPGRWLIAAVRPSELLRYSPLVYTADGGRSWSTGLVEADLAARPYALAASASGRALALAGAHGSAQVLSAEGSLSSWRIVATLPALAASTAGRSCALASLTAVGFLGQDPLAAGSCGRPGAIGIFRERATGWSLLEGAPPSALARDRIEVLALQAQAGGVRALLDASGAHGSSLVAAWYAAGRWLVSPPLALGASERLASLGPTDADGVFVLLDGASRAPRLAVASGPAAGWQQLPPPPAGTETVAFGPSWSVDALAANDTVLTVWSLPANARSWVLRQTIDVQIEFGSSE